jgi:hypothetical protein
VQIYIILILPQNRFQKAKKNKKICTVDNLFEKNLKKNCKTPNWSKSARTSVNFNDNYVIIEMTFS